ncbi:MAG TPA: hypothetical protein VF618_20205 [Thermoanaerobaculia bacterium]
MSDEATIALRAQLLQRGGRVAAQLPDALMAVILAIAVIPDFLTPEQAASFPPQLIGARDELTFLLFVEAGFLLMQGTLIDIATRLRKRPPVWVIALIMVGVVLLSREALQTFQLAWQLGMFVFIPLVVSVGQRGMALWTMPERSRIEKMAARALIGNRITTGIGLLGLLTVTMIAGVAFPSVNLFDSGWPALAAGALYFAIASFDDWRVRGRHFAERPRVLFGFDPLGIDYLAPL